MNIIDIIKRHTENSLINIEILFDEYSDSEWNQTINGFQIWQQLYHTINSMDRIFIDPENYNWPSFHIENLNNLEYKFEFVIKKEELYKYYVKVKESIRKYLESVSEVELFKRSNHKKIEMTKLDHILAQFRHMAFHFGYLHSCSKVMHGQTPEHISV